MRTPKLSPDQLLRPAETFAADQAPSQRQSESSLRLLARAIGGPKQIGSKLARIAATLALAANPFEYRRRLRKLHDKGLIETIPSRLQIAAGSLDMMRFLINPGAADYYRTRGIRYSFHLWLRILDDPTSMIDPVGIRTRRDTTIGHLLQTVHANPVYDFQILEIFDDGLDELERQTRQMLAGTHPRASSILAVVEEPGYHQRLLDYLIEYRKDPTAPMLLRRAGDARNDPYFILAECQFGTLPGFFRYASRMPRGLAATVKHLRNTHRLDPALCDADLVTQWDKLR